MEKTGRWNASHGSIDCESPPRVSNGSVVVTLSLDGSSSPLVSSVVIDLLHSFRVWFSGRQTWAFSEATFSYHNLPIFSTLYPPLGSVLGGGIVTVGGNFPRADGDLICRSGNLQSYWTTKKLRKLTVVLDY